MLRHLLALTIVCILVADAAATTLRRLDTPGLFRLASTVAIVEIGRTWVVEGRGKLSTFAEAVVTRSFKGHPAGTAITVLVPGGELGDWVQHVAGTPPLREGTAAVVFLEPAGAGALQFVGLEQGFLEIVPSKEQSGFVLRRESSAELVGRAAGAREAATLPALVEALDALARAGR